MWDILFTFWILKLCLLQSTDTLVQDFTRQYLSSGLTTRSMISNLYKQNRLSEEDLYGLLGRKISKEHVAGFLHKALTSCGETNDARKLALSNVAAELDKI